MARKDITIFRAFSDINENFKEVYSEGFNLLNFETTTIWDCLKKESPLAKLVVEDSFTLNFTNLVEGARGTIKLVTNTISPITITFDAALTHKKLGAMGHESFNTYILPTGLAKEYLLTFIREGSILHWIIGDVGSGEYAAYAISHGGYSVPPTGVSARYALLPGKMCHVYAIATGNGTSNDDITTMSLPFAAANTFVQEAPIPGFVNSDVDGSNGVLRTRVNSVTADLYIDSEEGVWGDTLGKRGFKYLNLLYETV